MNINKGSDTPTGNVGAPTRQRGSYRTLWGSQRTDPLSMSSGTNTGTVWVPMWVLARQMGIHLEKWGSTKTVGAPLGQMEALLKQMDPNQAFGITN